MQLVGEENNEIRLVVKTGLCKTDRMDSVDLGCHSHTAVKSEMIVKETWIASSGMYRSQMKYPQ